MSNLHFKSHRKMKRYLGLLLLFSSQITFGQVIRDTLLEVQAEFIFFTTKSSEISESQWAHIKNVVDSLPAKSGCKYVIEGHTDGQGGVDANMILSQRRSESTRQALIAAGIPESEISVSAFGKHRPLQNNGTEEGRKLNRRSRISIRKPFKLRLLTGNVIPDTSEINLISKILVYNKIYKDSVYTDAQGNFSIFVPVNQKIHIESVTKNYFSQTYEVITRTEIFVNPFKININAIRINSKFNIKNINFYGDQAIILPESKPALENLARTMMFNREVCFEVAGHVNDPGPPIYSGERFDLSTNRAIAVYEYLKSQMVSPLRMQYKGYSNFMMLYPNANTDEQMKQNRRVEIIIKKCDEINLK
jgi:outer membrane protein OmpA-like peptidoglycan-associated protein